jgi:hypothetical protein
VRFGDMLFHSSFTQWDTTTRDAVLSAKSNTGVMAKISFDFHAGG